MAFDGSANSERETKKRKHIVMVHNNDTDVLHEM